MFSGEYRFDGPASLSLFENDEGHWYDRDDYIGSRTVTESQAPGGLPLDFGEGSEWVTGVTAPGSEFVHGA